MGMNEPVRGVLIVQVRSIPHGMNEPMRGVLIVQVRSIPHGNE